MREISSGNSFPIGATVTADGVNFCVYSEHATAIELLLFDHADDAQPAEVMPLDSTTNRTWHYWHVFVPGLQADQLYGYRADGPNNPAAGLRFDRAKLLVDPYALAVANTENYSRAKAASPGDNTATAIKSVVVDPADYDWEGDAPLRRAFTDAVIYETHLAGFTLNPNSGVEAALRGTYAGFAEKIPYLQDLGIQAVEFMPVQQFDAQASPTGVNYWGYQPLAWFAPHRSYSSQRDVLAAVREFRDLVKALHRADIEVILDVVFNHTAEGDEHGPTLSLRGLDNPTYYLLDARNCATYVDDTGCGNTINGNAAIVRRMILDCLRYWVEHMHVDGFRFDLASSLSRGENSQLLDKPPVLLDIEADPVLAGTKIIAEPWDAAGLYQVASFAGQRWAVWNDTFRDHVRRFVKGDSGTVGPLADNLLASANLLGRRRRPCRSVNFVTAHDGFTLNDLVSYNQKHNEANGEQNRDGSDANYSWNCGAEGPSDDAQIEALRRRQVKNFLTILFVAEGRPMLLMGDEVRRTQRGNNNAYGLDDATTWFDWDDLARHAEIHRFTRGLLQFHQKFTIFRKRSRWSLPNSTQVTWHGVQLNAPEWDDASHALAMELHDSQSGEHLHVILNAYWESLEFALPDAGPNRMWRRLVDTALPSPEDLCDTSAELDNQQSYPCQARASVLLIASPK